jgi:acetyl-CoA carboxylase carboxyl transferase subunit alpha
MMMENTWYSVISPESCSSILWRSWEFKEQAAEALKLTAQDMKQFGLVDKIISEPLGGAHKDLKASSAILKDVILKEIKTLEKLSVEDRIAKRIDKFANMGVYKE